MKYQSKIKFIIKLMKKLQNKMMLIINLKKKWQESFADYLFILFDVEINLKNKKLIISGQIYLPL